MAEWLLGYLTGIGSTVTGVIMARCLLRLLSRRPSAAIWAWGGAGCAAGELIIRAWAPAAGGATVFLVAARPRVLAPGGAR